SPVRTAILKQLFLAKGKAVSVFDLQDELKIVVESNTIVQHIKIIRSEFQRVDPSFNCIRTVRGKGYRWVAPVG
ncbi:winged helix-turn-helix domain-containing protein, partial [Oleiphilus sp. HI0080]